MLHFSKHEDSAADTTRIPLVYGAVSTTYIIVSTYIFDTVVGYDPRMAFIEIAKGLGFVLVTSIILWAVLHRQYRSRR